MKIATYFQPVPLINSASQEALVDIWIQHWHDAGFHPIVLDREWAMQSQDAENSLAIFSSFPSINPPGYDLQCFLRWLAFRNMALTAPHENFCVADYDVFPNKLHQDQLVFKPGVGVTYHLTGIPSFVTFSGLKAVETWVANFLAYKVTEADKFDGRPHTSDMYIAQKFPEDINVWSQRNSLIEFGDGDWNKAPLIHFTTHVMTRAGLMPKHQHIPKLLAKIK